MFNMRLLLLSAVELQAGEVKTAVVISGFALQMHIMLQNEGLHIVF